MDLADGAPAFDRLPAPGGPAVHTRAGGVLTVRVGARSDDCNASFREISWSTHAPADLRDGT